MVFVLQMMVTLDVEVKLAFSWNGQAATERAAGSWMYAVVSFKLRGGASVSACRAALLSFAHAFDVCCARASSPVAPASTCCPLLELDVACTAMSVNSIRARCEPG